MLNRTDWSSAIAQAIATGVITLIVTPIALYVTLVYTNYFNNSDSHIVQSNIYFEYQKDPLEEELRKHIMSSDDFRSQINTALMAGMMSTNGEDPNAVLSMMDGFMGFSSIREADPILAQKASNSMRNLKNDYAIIVKLLKENLDLLSKEDQLALHDIPKIEENLMPYVANNNRDYLIKAYTAHLNKATKNIKALDYIVAELNQKGGLKNLHRTGGFTYSVGIVNRGYASDILEENGFLESKDLKIPITAIGESVFASIPAKEYKQFNYALDFKNISQDAKEKWIRLINSDQVFEFTVSVKSSSKELSESGTIYPKN
jgi:hypothetical protein